VTQVTDGRRRSGELEGVEEAIRRGATVVPKGERHHRAAAIPELRGSESVLRVARQAGVADRGDLRMPGQVRGDRKRTSGLAGHPQVEGPHPTDHHPGLVGRQVGAIAHHSLAQLRDPCGRSADDPAHRVAVAVDVLRQRVQHEVGAERRRPVERGRSECRVHDELGTRGMSAVGEGGDVGNA